MPEQIISSDFPCVKMGGLALDSDDAGADIYLKLGLRSRSKGALKTPKFISLLSSLLETSVQKNDILLEGAQIEDALSTFHGSRSPPVSIRQYIERIFKYAGCSPSCFIVAYIYVDRYLQQSEAFLTSLNVHRLLVTSVMVAAKFIDDAFYNNAYYAKVGGVSISEMNRLEMKLLFSLDFRLQVDVETFRNYCLQLEKEAGGCQIDGPVKACWVKESWSTKTGSPRTTPIAR
ncbi:hypothetical protein KSS87_010183 [Heliosperma pusillum]|nr:hypothetical protein KSS87_010183 [Heliosperma pusillum]